MRLYILNVMPYSELEIWILNNSYSRDNLPAVTYRRGEMHWYQNGELHREDGPASISKYMKSWLINDNLHREDGPAVIRTDGVLFWYLNGKFIKEQRGK